MKGLALIFSLSIMTACNGGHSRQKDNAVEATEVVGFVDNGNNNKENITIEYIDELTIYKPNYEIIDLYCGGLPDALDKTVILCCAAAFTGKEIMDFRHDNIAGDHVCEGKFYEGYDSWANTGCFAFFKDDRSWTFKLGETSGCMEEAVKRNGMAFGQAMIIYDGRIVANTERREIADPVRPGHEEQYRCLAEYNGNLCIIDSKETITYKEFIMKLKSIGVKNALYLDTGYGWNYSYYRDDNGQKIYIHDMKSPYTTNWIVFLKR